MSTTGRGKGNSPKIDLKLNLSQPHALNEEIDQAKNLMGSSLRRKSPENSGLSTQHEDPVSCSSRPEEGASMVLVGCPRCLMYVMLSEVDPRCPRCNSYALLHDFSTNQNNSRN